MNTALFLPARKAFPFLCIVQLLLLCGPVNAPGADPLPSMQTYCSEPPFAAAGIKSNLLLMIDNSASMYDLAYTDPSSYCLDDSYQNDNSYSGYFDQKSIYSYDFTNTKFVSKATLPSPPCSSSSCAASTDYLYVVMAGAVSPRAVSDFRATGNFLNWLSMSKLDIEKKALTGGKFAFSNSTSHGVLKGETRGCQGKRFVKMVGDATQITFAVRGPVFTDPGYLFEPSRGGSTTIEIYDKAYNKTACLAAVGAWLGKKGKDALSDQTNACMDVKQEKSKRGVNMPSAGAIFNLVMSDCYTHLVDNIPITTADLALDKMCSDRYHAIFGKFYTITDTKALDSICGGFLTHSPRSSNGDTVGFLGRCIDNLTGDLIANCAKNETIDFCNEITNPWVMDSPANADLTGSNANVPGFILDAGISNLGRVSGTFKVNVSLDSPPKGLVQEFGDRINFGAMVFHSDANSDGGQIISYINDPASPLGGHGTGLIAAIDQVAASAWTPLAESFYDAMGYFANRTDLRLQDADFDATTKPAPSRFNCQSNNILIVSDGMSMQDSNAKMEALASLYGTPRNAATGKDSANACPANDGSRSLNDLAWIASRRNIRQFSTAFASSDAPVTPAQSIKTHVIFTGTSNGAPGECDPAILMQETANSGGGIYASSSEPGTLYGTFGSVLRRIAEGTNSATDATILSTGDGNGAIFLHEQFYPAKSFDGGATSASWIGEMQSLWYYIDPFLGNSSGAASSIREDTDSDLKLNLKKDKIVTLRFDADNNRTSAYLTADVNGDGLGEGGESRVGEADQLKSLWRAGRQLWARDLSAAPRTIYLPLVSGGTELNGTGLMKFSWGSPASVTPYLNLLAGDPEAGKLMKFIHGFDYPGDAAMRTRTVTVSGVDVASDPKNTGVGVWKLGDIISSTPQAQSPVPLGSYHLPSPRGYQDRSYSDFVASDAYQARGMVYVGANDGMLHAFTLGKLDSSASLDRKATLAGSELGKEQWAFLPKNALPYLKYLADPGYAHLYYVDGTSTLIDASIGATSGGSCSSGSYWSCAKTTGNWRTVLIGGMGLGGASCKTGESCVPTPLAEPGDPTRRLGYSSYFALDVTDPKSPALLWEFSDPALGFSTTGPAIVRIGDPAYNGRWFAVFGSGPTGPVVNGQFLGHSGQKLKFFVVDLNASPPFQLNRNFWVIDTLVDGSSIDNAFAGSLSGAGIDVDKRKGSYQDDALYAGYTKRMGDGSSTPYAWTGGGIVRILTGEDPDPSKWKISTVIGGIGPVTGSISRLQDTKNKNLWLYFGTGRYFFSGDDLLGERALYGVREPCYNRTVGGVIPSPDNLEPTCAASVSAGSLNSGSDGPGWRIDLDRATSLLGAERVITNPTSSTSGAVFFITFQPNLASCQVDTSYLWGVKYDTGGTIPDGAVNGKVLVPLSTGSVQETGLSGALTDKDKRRGSAMKGKPGGVKVVSNSGLKPLKKIIHIQER